MTDTSTAGGERPPALSPKFAFAQDLQPAVATLKAFSPFDRLMMIIAVGVLALVALVIILVFAVVLFGIKVDPVELTLLTVVVGAPITALGVLTGWLWGSSKSSHDKNDTIAALATPPLADSSSSASLGLGKTAAAFLLACIVFGGLSACSFSDAPALVQTAKSIDPTIAPDIAKACAVAAPGIAALQGKLTGQNAATLAALTEACKPQGQKDMTANDTKPVTATNSGDSGAWVRTTLAFLKVAGGIASLFL